MRSMIQVAMVVLALFFLPHCQDFPPEDFQVNQQGTPSWTYLALGDSYTIGESVEEEERWPVQLADRLRSDGGLIPVQDIIARTGWTTGNLIDAIDFENPTEDYDLVSLLIGVNNQFQNRSLDEYKTQFEELLNTAIRLAKGDTSRVFVLSIPDYGFTPFGQSNQAAISMEIDVFNEAHRTITESYGIPWFDITEISRRAFDEPGYVANDGLHPSAFQYQLWVNEIYEGVKALLLP